MNQSFVRKLRAQFRSRLATLLLDRRGNVLMLTGLAIIPMTAAVGIGVDYARAARLLTKMNAAADAAALAAVTQPMMRKDDVTARAAAINMFNTQVTGLGGLIYDPANLTVSVTDSIGAVSARTVQISYNAQSSNAFGGILKLATLPLRGVTQTRATIAPNIDFYLALDTSPSMALPATTAGITDMVNQTGCAFACHQTDVSGGGTTWYNGTRMSYYQFARAKGIALRTDLVSEAVRDLTTVAETTAAQNGANYRMALAQFNFKYTPMVVSPSSPSTVAAAAPNATILPYCRNNQRVCGTGDNDTATNFSAMIAGALAQMPTVSGTGTPQLGDSPQSMLFLVTDGMRDETESGRKMGPIPTALCDTVKARGIRIAILYTEYLASAASDQWSIDNVRTPFLSPTDRITPALTSCASPGLFYKVTTDGDISAALTTLFRQAISTPRLVQ